MGLGCAFNVHDATGSFMKLNFRCIAHVSQGFTCRSSDTEPGRTVQIPTLRVADGMSPSSPWPELEYDPETQPDSGPTESGGGQYEVEVLVDGDGAPQIACNVRMAQVFEEKPYLRRQLVGILQGCQDDATLKMQATLPPLAKSLFTARNLCS